MRALALLLALALPSACVGEASAVIGPADFTPVLSPSAKQSLAHVGAYRLDVRPVTNAEFAQFVRSHPQWRRDRVASLFVDADYLAHWPAADRIGGEALPEQPVTRVSWYAARAYCEARKARLPTWYEWEYAAAANEHVTDARTDPAWRERMLAWYARPGSDPLASAGLGTANLYGVRDLHDLVWEWVEDFNSLMLNGGARSDADTVNFCGAGALDAKDREAYPVLMRIAFLSSLEARSTSRRLGFRCAVDVP